MKSFKEVVDFVKPYYVSAGSKTIDFMLSSLTAARKHFADINATNVQVIKEPEAHKALEPETFDELSLIFDNRHESAYVEPTSPQQIEENDEEQFCANQDEAEKLADDMVYIGLLQKSSKNAWQEQVNFNKQMTKDLFYALRKVVDDKLKQDNTRFSAAFSRSDTETALKEIGLSMPDNLSFLENTGNSKQIVNDLLEKLSKRKLEVENDGKDLQKAAELIDAIPPLFENADDQSHSEHNFKGNFRRFSNIKDEAAYYSNLGKDSEDLDTNILKKVEMWALNNFDKIQEGIDINDFDIENIKSLSEEYFKDKPKLKNFCDKISKMLTDKNTEKNDFFHRAMHIVEEKSKDNRFNRIDDLGSRSTEIETDFKTKLDSPKETDADKTNPFKDLGTNIRLENGRVLNEEDKKELDKILEIGYQKAKKWF